MYIAAAEEWEKDPAKNRQKDKENKSFFGYKNHVNADAMHKLIRQYDVPMRACMTVRNSMRL
jgi:hypothetical protein